jgi:hypothetical protein
MGIVEPAVKVAGSSTASVSQPQISKSATAYRRRGQSRILAWPKCYRALYKALAPAKSMHATKMPSAMESKVCVKMCMTAVPSRLR